MSLPEIRKLNGIDTFFVHDEPFFGLGGELHNSASASLEYMDEHVWPYIENMNMNMIITPISWENVEPEEGVFDFSLVDGLIAQARQHNMHHVFIWFGLWKNAESMYAPQWMKLQNDKYFMAKKVNGDTIHTISPFCEAAIEKDCAAFKKVMEHLKEVDSEQNTVIAIQVENEIGILGSARDYSDTANKLFEAEVPSDLLKKIDVDKKGSWKEVFGDDAEEYFMAWGYASAIEKITQAGQSVYKLPCYANSWLRQYPWYPGSYPVGGPVVTVHHIWKAMAPSLFCLAPDIYVPYVPQIMDEYTKNGNALFIPEVRKDAVTASYCLYAFGKHNALAYCPFGIEEITMDPDLIDKPPMEVMIALNIDPSAFDIKDSKDYLRRVYGLITEMKPLYLKYRGTDKLQTYCRTGENDFGAYLKFEKYDLSVAYAPRQSAKPLGAGMVYELAEDTFLIVGMMSSFKFMPKPGVNGQVQILRLEEGDIINGEWVRSRILNGDEQMMLNAGPMTTCRLVKLYTI